MQPYLALALRLLTFGHRVRLATHGTFASFVRSASNGRVESFDIGGDPKELLAWMVKNPSLLPSFESMTNGDVGRKQKQLAEVRRSAKLSYLLTARALNARVSLSLDFS